MKLTHLDLFSGIGGFAIAAQEAGFQTIGFSEVNPFCCSLLRYHWPDIHNYGDIKHLQTPPKVDLVTGGFPCQPFSTSGHQRGVKDHRWLWPDMLRVITDSRATWVVGENVANLSRMALDYVLSDLEREGYTCQTFNIPACAINAPHRRERLWIVAHSTGGRCDMRQCDREAGQILPDTQRDSAQSDSQRGELFTIPWEADPDSGWDTYLNLCSGVDDGLPHRLDALHGLGNAIVPGVAAIILRHIYSLTLL